MSRLNEHARSRVEISEVGKVNPLPASSGPPRQELKEVVTATLLQKARSGSPTAWSKLYRDHFPMVYRRIRLLTGKMSLAEELTQETFVQAMLHIARFRENAKFSTWLCGIAYNLVRSHWRKVQNTQTAHERLKRISEHDRPDTVDNKLSDRQRVEAIYAALEELPDNLRVVFVLRYFEGMNSAEIADTLELTVNNVDVRVSRARRRIKAVLDEKGWLPARVRPS